MVRQLRLSNSQKDLLHANTPVFQITLLCHTHYKQRITSPEMFIIFIHRSLKVLLGGAGSNLTPDLVKKYGRIEEPLHHICHEFDRETGASTSSVHQQRHSKPNVAKDMLVGTKSLYFADVFEDKGRTRVRETRDSSRQRDLFTYMDDRQKRLFTAWLQKKCRQVVKT